MNCLDVRRVCLVEPGSRDPRLLLHIYHCPACRKFRKRVLAAELDVKTAMNVSVPEGLGRRIAFDSSMDHNRSRGWPRWQAMAATVMVAIALGVALHGMNNKRDLTPALARHTMEDPLHMTPPQADVSRRLHMVMKHLEGVWTGDSSILTHATVCVVHNMPAAHLVARGKEGPVTVYLVPRYKARTLTRHLDGQVVEVLELGNGSLALFGYEGEDLAPVRAIFTKSVDWKQVSASVSRAVRVAGIW